MTRRGNDRADESFLVRFARDYGWRAYAIPVLTVITIWVLFDVFAGADEQSGGGADSSTSASATSTTGSEPEATRGPGPDPAQAPDGNLPPTQLPPGGDYATTGEQNYRVIGQPGAQAGEGTELTLRYVIEVEEGVDTNGYGGDNAVAAFIDATLTDPRGWTDDPRFRFEHVGPDDDPDLNIQLTSVDSTHELCGGNDLAMETSCRTTLGGGSTVVINDSRWSRGAGPFEGDLGSYRQYLINHEVGHALGFSQHVPCGGDGELAPIMMQQTLSLNNSELFSFNPDEVYEDDHRTCRYNPWPYPQPGAEPIQDGA